MTFDHGRSRIPLQGLEDYSSRQPLFCFRVFQPLLPLFTARHRATLQLLLKLGVWMAWVAQDYIVYTS